MGPRDSCPDTGSPAPAAEATFQEAAIAARPELGQDGVLSTEKNRLRYLQRTFFYCTLIIGSMQIDFFLPLCLKACILTIDGHIASAGFKEIKLCKEIDANNPDM